MEINFSNSYDKLPMHFFEKTKPAKFFDPKLLIFNHNLAQSLGLKVLNDLSEKKLADYFSGQIDFKGASHIAMAYAAHQFGHFVPKLGDGRALLLGEVKGFDIQLKGGGQTPFSRRGDGRSSLGPVIREYLVSEAMHALDVPTTRALAAVMTGESVYRHGQEPGGVFTRVAPSHIRVGTFQYFAARHDIEGLKTLLNYTLKRHYKDLELIEDRAEQVLRFLEEVTHKQAFLVGKWMSLGFIHGVMNTDNFTVGGHTLDYGPCAFMDEYKESKVFSSIDRQGRYSYRNQIPIAQWNILRLADCLWPLVHDDQEAAISIIEKRLNPVMDTFLPKRWEMMAPKFGFKNHSTHNIALMQRFLALMERESLDFTLSFSRLSESTTDLSSYFPDQSDFKEWFFEWKKCGPEFELMLSNNPYYIPRNHLVQNAIDKAYSGDYSFFHKLNLAWQKPFEKQVDHDLLSTPPSDNERVTETFCGT